MLDREFGRYRLIRRLGRGGMADVYLARDTRSDSAVALKLLEVRADADSREMLDAERRGAILQAQFGQVEPRVPRLHEWGTEGEYFYIDMEYVDGEDLAEMIARGVVADERAAWIAGEICAFLARAHAFDAVVDGRPLHAIIHADIKPRNVRINRAGEVRVLDFGIAKGLALSRKLTRNDFGSLAYLSPERLDTGDVDVHVDFWSVGVLLYEMLAGRPPFREENSQKLERLIRSRQPPPPLPDGCATALQRIVFRMLAPDRERRYQSAAEIGADLQAFLGGRETRADREWPAAGPPDDATRRTAPEETAAAGAHTADRTRPTPPGEASGEPDEATRRTREPSVGDPSSTEETRRSLGEDLRESVAPAAAGAGQPGPGPAPGAAARRWTSRTRRVVLSVAALVLVGLVGNEASVWSAARDLRASLPARDGAGMNDVWDRYQSLSRRSLLGLALIGVRRPLEERLVVQADRVIADYRQDEPAVREAQWRDAVTWLTHASRLDPANPQITARLRYAEGHLYRIAGEARKRRKQPAAQALHEAIARFEEAGRINRSWPDPYLGLARTYVYGLDDLERALDAFEEAERRGYQPGNRELALLADGYRNRGDRLRREAAGLRGLPQEADLLRKVADDYRRAIDYYRQVLGFGDASANMRLVQKRLDEVETSLFGR